MTFGLCQSNSYEHAEHSEETSQADFGLRRPASIIDQSMPYMLRAVVIEAIRTSRLPPGYLPVNVLIRPRIQEIADR